MKTSQQSVIHSENFKPGVSGWKLTPSGAVCICGRLSSQKYSSRPSSQPVSGH